MEAVLEMMQGTGRLIYRLIGNIGFWVWHAYRHFWLVSVHDG